MNVVRSNISVFFTASLFVLSACSGNISQSGDAATAGSASDANGVSIPFSAFSAETYVNKVKTELTGVAATDAEIAAVTKDSTALSGLIAQWQQLPSYKPKMVHFLDNAFQQSEVFTTDFAMQGVAIDSGTLGAVPSAMLLGNLHDLVAQTVIANDAANMPFKTIMSTSTFQMTKPLAIYYAYLDQVMINDAGKTVTNNTGATLKSMLAALTATDYNTWVPVTIRQPKAGETTTTPSSITTLAAGTTLILNTPRVGFFTTPTFLAGWQTNVTNQARVTINQALIVALNHAFDGTLVAQPVSLAALDAAHAPPTSACYSCHVNMDPMRQFYRQAYSISYSVQNNPNEMALPGQFAFDGVSTQGTSIYDLGTGFANHASLPAAWVQKLCTYANDSVCDASDPEFQRITTNFAASQSLTKLVQDLFSSPIVTYASKTVSAATLGQTISVTKTDHLCPLFAARLGLPDPCSVAPGAAPTGTAKTLQLIASILPANAYSRGQIAPVFANTPTLFFRAGIENVCAILAAEVVDASGNTTYVSSDPNTTVSNIVHTLMGVPTNEDQEPISILLDHYNAAVAAGLTAPQAMQSTFVAGCLSPGVTAVGE